MKNVTTKETRPSNGEFRDIAGGFSALSLVDETTLIG
jgi:hypothetical protein